MSNLSPRSIELIWNFRFANDLLSNDVSYQVRSLNGGSNRLLYQGTEKRYLFDEARPFTSYTFELVSYNRVSQAILDRKLITVLTLSDDPKLVENPKATLVFAQPANHTILVNLNWNASFELNGLLTSYHVTVNDQLVYTGLDSNVTALIEQINCLSGFYYLDVRMQVVTYTHSLLTPVILMLNCSGNSSYTIFFQWQIKI